MRSVPAGLPVPVGRRGGRGAATRDSCPCLRVRQHDRLLRNSGSYCSAPRRPSPLRTVSAARARSRDNRDGFGDQCAPHCAERPRFLAARDSYTGANARPHRSAARACAGAAAHAARRPLRCSTRARTESPVGCGLALAFSLLARAALQPFAFQPPARPNTTRNYAR